MAAVASLSAEMPVASSLSPLKGHRDTVNCIEFNQSLSFSMLASGSDDGTVRLWDLRQGRAVRCIDAFGRAPVQLIAWGPIQGSLSNSLWAAAGRSLFAFDLRACSDNEETQRATILRQPSFHLDEVCAAGEDGDDEISSLQIQRSGATTAPLVAAADDSGTVHILAVESNHAPPMDVNMTSTTTTMTRRVDDLPVDSSVAAGVRETSASACMRTLRRQVQLRASQTVCAAALFRPNNRWELVTGGLDGSIALWDLSRAQPKNKNKKNKQKTTDGKVGEDSAIPPIWREMKVPSVEEAVGSEAGEGGQSFNPPLVQAMAAHDSGKYFAAGLGDGSIALYSFKQSQKGQPCHWMRCVRGHQASVAAVHWANFSDNLLLSAGNDRVIAMWNGIDPSSHQQYQQSWEKMPRAMSKKGGHNVKNRNNQGNSKDSHISREPMLPLVRQPNARLAHDQKVNWLASQKGSSGGIFCIADVSNQIAVRHLPS